MDDRDPSGGATAGRPELETAIELVTDLGRSLHRYGGSAHRLETALGQVATGLGLEGQFFSTPTAIFASYRPVDRSEPARTVLSRVEPGDLHLEKLSSLDAVLEAVAQGRIRAEEGVRRVAEIEEEPPRYGRPLTVLAFALSSGATARFFGGGPEASAAAAAIGLLIGALTLLADRLPQMRRVLEAVAACLAAVGATAASRLLGSSFFAVTAASLIVLLPGLTLTVAMTELASRHLVSGAARLAGALLVFLTIGVGFGVGSRIGAAFWGEPGAGPPVELGTGTEVLSLVVAASALLVLFRAHPRDLGWFLLAAAGAWYGGRSGSLLLGPELGALLGALLVGVGANSFARLARRPAAIIQLPGLMLLVPGSLGFRSVTALVARDTLAGVQGAFTVGIVAISLVTGLLLANVLVSPRRAL